MNSRYVLVLISLNPDRTDCSGNIYPEIGHIKAKEFQPDRSILKGLYGTAWANYLYKRWLNPHPEGQWCVVKTSRNSIIPLDKDNGLIKFDSGMVVLSGTKKECENFIVSQRPDAGIFGRQNTVENIEISPEMQMTI